MAFSTNFRQPIPINQGISYPGSVAAPPLPPRNYSPTATSSYSQGTAGYPRYGSNYGFNSYGLGGGGFGSYGGYGTTGYGGYGGYGSYGSFGGAYGYGGITNSENRFIQIAENSARPAFDSFRSVMGMLQSVTMMFDSTFNAVHASYASVLGVADNFSRLRSMFAGVFSAFSVVKALNWLYRKLLRLVGMQAEDPSLGAAWASTLNENLPAGATPAQPQTWPAVALMALIIAGPFLIMKIVSRMVPPDTPTAVWDPMEEAGTRADVMYNFTAGTPQELSVVPGQALMVAPKQHQPATPGWMLVCDSRRRIGLVPANYIKIENEANLKAVIPPSQSATNFSPASQLAPTLSNILPQAALDSKFQQRTSNSHSIGNNSFETDAGSIAPTSTDVTPTLEANVEVRIPPMPADLETGSI